MSRALAGKMWIGFHRYKGPQSIFEKGRARYTDTLKRKKVLGFQRTADLFRAFSVCGSTGTAFAGRLNRTWLAFESTNHQARELLEALMYIANDNQASVGRVRHETLRRWVEELLASEHLDAAAADNVRDAVASKLHARAERRGSS